MEPVDIIMALVDDDPVTEANSISVYLKYNVLRADSKKGQKQYFDARDNFLAQRDSQSKGETRQLNLTRIE